MVTPNNIEEEDPWAKEFENEPSAPLPVEKKIQKNKRSRQKKAPAEKKKI